jgi:1,4-dihydroxy-2-naphthoate polyprenyltransferase
LERALLRVSLDVGVTLGCLPRGRLLGLLTFGMAAASFLGDLHHADDVPRLLPFMTLNVLITLTTPILIAIRLSVT